MGAQPAADGAGARFSHVPRSVQQEYDLSMSGGKVRKTLTLDPDIVEVLGGTRPLFRPRSTRYSVRRSSAASGRHP